MVNQKYANTPSSLQKHEGDPLGQVLCFVSAKGGTGKTILSAASTYALLQCGLRVVAIDTDFSTRGLSLLLLGSILESHELNLQSKNCLADSILDNVAVHDLTPRKIVHGAVEYNVVISNKDVFRGGVPDERFLGPKQKETNLPLQYFNYLRDLCQRFRKEYDYIIIDTRGGYDFTSALPAIVSDGYVVVIEADKVSMEQVSGFKKQIDSDAASLSRLGERQLQAILKGFIVNKAIFSVDERFFPDALAREYASKTFGVIPIDKDAIRAYQNKNIPQEKFPDSDFSYHSLCAIEHLTSPSFNWPQDKAKRFKRYLSSIRSEWRVRQRIELAQRAVIPITLLLLAAAFSLFYLWFKYGSFGNSLRLFYISSTLFVLIAIIGSMFSTLALFRAKEVEKWKRLSTAGVFVILLISLTYLAGFDIPKTFSQNLLLQRVQERDQTITLLEQEKSQLQQQLLKLDTDNKILITDKQQLERSLNESQSRIIDMEDDVSNAKVQAASIKRDRDATYNALSLAEQRATDLQQKLNECRRIR